MWRPLIHPDTRKSRYTFAMARGARRQRGPLWRIRWWFEFLVLRGIRSSLIVLPHSWRLAVGRGIGRTAFLLDRRHARVAVDNLAAAYPDLDARWHRRTAREVFAHLGRLLVEILLARWELHRLSSRMHLEGLEHLHSVLAAGRGYFLLSGHFGNWEWVALLQGLMGHPLWMVARALTNPHLEQWFAETRQASGNRVVHKHDALREIVKGLKGGRGIAFVVDQYFPERGAHVVPFFGRAAATTPALGALAVRMRVPVLPVFAYPQEDGSYRIRYEEPIWPAVGADPDAAALDLTLEATRRIERAVRSQPEAWFWVHRRWREPHPEATAAPVTQPKAAPNTKPHTPARKVTKTT